MRTLLARLARVGLLTLLVFAAVAAAPGAASAQTIDGTATGKTIPLGNGTVFGSRPLSPRELKSSADLRPGRPERSFPDVDCLSRTKLEPCRRGHDRFRVSAASFGRDRSARGFSPGAVRLPVEQVSYRTHSKSRTGLIAAALAGSYRPAHAKGGDSGEEPTNWIELAVAAAFGVLFAIVLVTASSS